MKNQVNCPNIWLHKNPGTDFSTIYSWVTYVFLRLESKHFSFIVFSNWFPWHFLWNVSLFGSKFNEKESICLVTAVSQPQNSACLSLYFQYIFIELMKKCDSSKDTLEMWSFTLYVLKNLWKSDKSNKLFVLKICTYNYADSFKSLLDSVTHVYGPQFKKFCSKKNIKINFIIWKLRWSIECIIFACITSTINCLRAWSEKSWTYRWQN